MTLKKLNMSVFIALIFSLFISCKKQDSSTSARPARASTSNADKQITIGFSIDTLAIERWQRDMDVFINKVKEMGADVIVQETV